MIEARMKIDKLNFGKFVASRRKGLQEPLTQDMLAKKLHVGTSAIGKIEAGETLPSFELFIDLADALEMTPGDLMMVMAERELPKGKYLEMNEWLYERLVEVVEEYNTLVTPPPAQHPQLTSGKNKHPNVNDEVARGIVEAKKTPDVKPPKEPPPDAESNPDQEPVDQNPTPSSK